MYSSGGTATKPAVDLMPGAPCLEYSMVQVQLSTSGPVIYSHYYHRPPCRFTGQKAPWVINGQAWHPQMKGHKLASLCRWERSQFTTAANAAPYAYEVSDIVAQQMDVARLAKWITLEDEECLEIDKAHAVMRCISKHEESLRDETKEQFRCALQLPYVLKIFPKEKGRTMASEFENEKLKKEVGEDSGEYKALTTVGGLMMANEIAINGALKVTSPELEEKNEFMGLGTVKDCRGIPVADFMLLLESLHAELEGNRLNWLDSNDFTPTKLSRHRYA